MKLEVNPQWLRASANGRNGEVNRDKGVIYGVILAEEGPFKSEGRGEFDRKAIRQIVKMGNEKNGGLKVRWTHPGLSSDGLGKYLGRQKNLRSDTVLRQTGTDENGQPVYQERLVARGDLHFDKTALDTPPEGGKPLGIYVMDLAESDPDAFGTSLVLKPRQEYRLDKQGKPLKDELGNELPPLWYPEALHASDVVDTGDATNSFLSADILAGLPDAVVRQGCELLDRQFEGQDKDAIRARLAAFVERYLSLRFPGDDTESLADEPETTDTSANDDEDEDLLLEIEMAKG